MRVTVRKEEGSGTVLVICVVVVAVLAVGVVVAVSIIGVHRARAEAVADLAALAAGDVSATAQWEEVGDRPCSAAREVVEANGLSLASCEVVGVDARVLVEDRVSVGGVPVSVHARARAGPDSDAHH